MRRAFRSLFSARRDESASGYEGGEILKPNLRVGAYTIPENEKLPNSNQDSYMVHIGESSSLFGVFDGMGGHAGGAFASRKAVEAVKSLFDGGNWNVDDIINSPELAITRMIGALEEADRAVKALSASRPEIRGCGSTALLCTVFPNVPRGEVMAAIVHVGDSRAYLLRDSKLISLTLDDGVLRQFYNEKEQAKYWQDYLSEVSGLEELQRAINSGKRVPRELLTAFNRRNVILQALGGHYMSGRDGLQFNVTVESLWKNDRIILMTDGVYDVLTTSYMRDMALRTKNPSELAYALCIQAAQLGKMPINGRGRLDDRTAVVIDVSVQSSAKARLLAERPPRENEGRPLEKLTPQGLYDYINNLPVPKSVKTSMYKVVGDILSGNMKLDEIYKFSDQGLWELTEAVGCRYYTSNMVRGGHREVFLGARLGYNQQDIRILYNMLDALGGLEGSMGWMESEGLKQIAFEVLKGERSVMYATSTYGFRRALQIMLQEKTQQDAKSGRFSGNRWGGR